MNFYQSLRQFVVGAPLDPLSRKTRHNLALVAFFAWVGLGADGISSSCYGPEEAFKALGEHAHLGLYLAFATMATVFIIALAFARLEVLAAERVAQQCAVARRADQFLERGNQRLRHFG